MNDLKELAGHQSEGAGRVATANVLAEVGEERIRQDEKWGQQNHPDGTGGDVARSLRDQARRRCDRAHHAGEGTWEQILTEEYREALAESNAQALRRELVQLAAVAVGWVEALDRRAT